jgi:hypothetical protein
MLIYQHNTNILALLRESVKRLLYCRFLGFRIANEEVLLRIGGIGNVTNASE